jgi:hypothetical protein
MTKPVGLQLSRARGFNLQRLSIEINGLPAIKVDRSTRWGNPWIVGEPVDLRRARRWGWEISPSERKRICRSNTDAYTKFRHALLWDTANHNYVRRELGGNNLACWCGHDEDCHRIVLLWVANSTPQQVLEFQDAYDDFIMRITTILLPP